jgi:hypothetical protein
LKIAGYFAFYSTINEALLRKTMFMYNVNYFLCGFLKPLKTLRGLLKPAYYAYERKERTVFICSSRMWIQRLDEDRISGRKILQIFLALMPLNTICEFQCTSICVL